MVNYLEKYGLTNNKGVQYGWVDNTFIVFRQGEGRTTTIQIYLCLSVQAEKNPEKIAQALLLLHSCSSKQYKLVGRSTEAITISSGTATIRFAMGNNMFKNIAAFLDTYLPQLREINIAGGDCCAKCGESLNGDSTVVFNDDNVIPVHNHCVIDLERIAEDKNLNTKSGSVLTGTIGAFLGAVVGAIPWAALLMIGYFASIVGLLIAWLANFGYGLFRGKNSKARPVVVVLMVVVGVLLGQTAGFTAQLLQEYDDTTFPSVSEYMITCTNNIIYDQKTSMRKEYERQTKDIPAEELQAKVASGEYMSVDEFIEEYYDTEFDTAMNEARLDLIKDCLLGLFFGLLGSYGILKRTMNDTKGHRVLRLKSVDR